MRAIGTEAVPTLLYWLRQSDSSLSRNTKIVVEWRLRLPFRVPTNEDNRMRAMYGFRALGLAAGSAFPELVAIALKSPDEWQRGDAINALTDSGADAMRQLAAGLEDPDREVRLRAVHALACIRIAPHEVCLPALEGALNDPDAMVRAEAAKGIALFDHQLKTLAGLLDHPNPEFRAVAARIVGGYRSRADTSCPPSKPPPATPIPRCAGPFPRRSSRSAAVQGVQSGEGHTDVCSGRRDIAAARKTSAKRSSLTSFSDHTLTLSPSLTPLPNLNLALNLTPLRIDSGPWLNPKASLKRKIKIRIKIMNMIKSTSRIKSRRISALQRRPGRLRPPHPGRSRLFVSSAFA